MGLSKVTGVLLETIETRDLADGPQNSSGIDSNTKFVLHQSLQNIVRIAHLRASANGGNFWHEPEQNKEQVAQYDADQITGVLDELRYMSNEHTPLGELTREKIGVSPSILWSTECTIFQIPEQNNEDFKPWEEGPDIPGSPAWLPRSPLFPSSAGAAVPVPSESQMEPTYAVASVPAIFPSTGNK